MKQWLALKTISAAYADLSERKLREFIGHDTHPLPVRRVAGQWLVNRDELDRWLQGFPRAGKMVTSWWKRSSGILQASACREEERMGLNAKNPDLLGEKSGFNRVIRAESAISKWNLPR
jgi:Helix-turn-helix domain